ncbi:uncharacterized protein WCC33_012727 [Rhinophrynus dorsalis]
MELERFDVGAEIELKDGIIVDDSTPIKLENKLDLPVWLTLHYLDDSSGDESYEPPTVHSPSSECESLEADLYNENKTYDERDDQVDQEINLLSISEDLQMVYDIQQEDESLLWYSMYEECVEEQADLLMVAQSIPEIKISTELDQSSYESQEGKIVGNNCNNVRLSESVKSSVNDHQCQTCGRQFRLLSSLEKHLCLKTLGFPQDHAGNRSQITTRARSRSVVKGQEKVSESDDMLEHVCGQAQKELQTLHEQYSDQEIEQKRKNKQTPKIVKEEDPQETLSDDQKGTSDVDNAIQPKTRKRKYKPAPRKIFVCDRCGRQFRNQWNQDQHICCPRPPQESSLQKAVLPSLGQQASSQSISQDIDTIKILDLEKTLSCSNAADGVFQSYTCQQCDRVFDRYSSYATHTRWHMKESNYLKFVVENKRVDMVDTESIVEHSAFIQPQKKQIPFNEGDTGQLYPCEECGRIFQLKSNLVRHQNWHMCYIEEDDNMYNQQGSSYESSVERVPGSEDEGDGTVTKFKITQDFMDKESKMKTSNYYATAASNRELKSYTCQHCGRLFEGYRAYATHSRWHMKEYMKFLAEKQKGENEGGDQQDASSQLLKQQSQLGGKTEKEQHFPCDDCGRVFRHKSSLVRHLRSQTHQNLFVGKEQRHPTDDAMFSALELYQQGPSFVVPESSFEQMSGTENENILTSDKIIDELLNKEMIEENDVAPTSENLEWQLNHVESELNLQTPEVKKVKRNPILTMPRELLVRLSKRPQPPQKCQDCGARFYQTWQLKRHQCKIRKHSKHTTRRKQKCDCGRSPVGSLHFLRHQLQHLSDTAFICEECGKALRGYHQLRAHSWVHPLVSRFQCSCGAMFTQLPRYLWHTLLNSSDRRKREKGKKRKGRKI